MLTLKLLLLTFFLPIYGSMATSSQIHSMRTSNISFAVIRLPHMLMTLSLPIPLVFQGIKSLLINEEISRGIMEFLMYRHKIQTIH